MHHKNRIYNKVRLYLKKSKSRGVPLWFALLSLPYKGYKYVIHKEISRIDLLKKLPQNGIVAEIGVYKGDYAVKIVENCKPKKLFLIDPWCDHDAPYDYAKDGKHEERYKNVQNKFRNFDNVTLIKKFSMDAVDMFPDESFDWIYIDANHTYPKIKEDLKAWYLKIKKGGYICGHDYIENYKTYGVKKAVDEFIKINKLKINFLTSETFASWAIKKI